MLKTFATRVAALASATVLWTSVGLPVANALTSSDMSSTSSKGSSNGSSISDAFTLSSKLGQALTMGNGTTTHSTKQVSVSGQGTRSYELYVPSDYDSSRDYPVVFAYSGMDFDGSDMHGHSHLERATGSDAIVVYPNPRASVNGGLAWEGPNYATTSRGEDVAFTKAILNDVANSYSVDRSRVYATGLSNGGGMALAAACQAPETFAAVAGVSTAAYTRIFDGCTGQVPTLLIHGTDDKIAPYYNDGSNGHGGSYYATRGAWERIGKRNACDTSGASMRTGSGNGYNSFSYSGCLAETTLYRVNGGSHTWFASNPNATREVWNFFQRH